MAEGGGGNGGGGAGGGFDPCECIWNHVNSMARLLNMLRNSQTTCTDENCTDQLPELPGAGPSEMGWSVLMMMGAFLVATLLFVLRPASLRLTGGSTSDEKPRNNNNNDRNDGPPAPPIE